MDKFISIVKGIEAVAAALIGTVATGADPHNPLTWLALIYSAGQGLNAVFHWKQQ